MVLGLGCLLSPLVPLKIERCRCCGVALGIGLMMDRLTLLFFVLPPALPYLKDMSSTARKNMLLAGLMALLITGAYYREFFQIPL